MNSDQNLNKGLLEALFGSLSPRERHMLLIAALIANKKMKTRGEQELRRYSEEKRMMDKAIGGNMEKFMSDNIGGVIDELGRLNSLGLNRSEIIKRIAENAKKNISKLATDGVKQTNEPDVPEFAYFKCGTCGFTIDAVSDLPANRECARCGAKPMVGINWNEYHTKNNYKGFNEVTDENAKKLPEPPKVKP